MATKTVWEKHEATFTRQGENRIRKAAKVNGACRGLRSKKGER